MDLEALRCMRKEIFQLGRRLGEMSRVILRDRRLKLAVKLLVRIIFGYCNRCADQKTTKNDQPKLGPSTHSPPLFFRASHVLNENTPEKRPVGRAFPGCIHLSLVIQL